MAARSDVRILVNDQEFWDAVEWSIESDMLQDADAFSVTVANPQGATRARLNVHDQVRVLVDETVQMTGWIDDLNLTGDARSGATIEVVGRDKFGQLVDNSALPHSWTGKDLLQIAKDISTPWVTDWFVDNEENRRKLLQAQRNVRTVKAGAEKWARYMADASALFRAGLESTTDVERKRLAAAQANLARIKAIVFPRVKAAPGESIMEVLERASRKVGMMIWQAADGTGIIARPNYAQAPLYRLQLHPSTLDTASANNVKSWSHALTGRDTYYEYRLSCTSANTSNAYAANSHHEIVQYDDTVALERRKITGGSGQNRAQAKIEFERDIQQRRFESVVLNYVVQGHAQDGRLWQVDTLVAVDDRINNISGDWYLTKRRFVGSRGGGQTTELTLHQKGVLLP